MNLIKNLTQQIFTPSFVEQQEGVAVQGPQHCLSAQWEISREICCLSIEYLKARLPSYLSKQAAGGAGEKCSRSYSHFSLKICLINIIHIPA